MTQHSSTSGSHGPQHLTDPSVDALSGTVSDHDQSARDAADLDGGAAQLSARVGARAGILAGLTLGAFGVAMAMSLTTVSVAPPA